MHNFDVSVVIPAYNSEKTICRALSSVVQQTLQPAEIIVVDDGSTDRTAFLVKNFYGDLKPGFLKLVELGTNHGASYARNIGWDMASGEFLAFLDSDDSWLPRKLEIQSICMLEHDELTLTAHRCVCFSEGNKLPVIPRKWNMTPIARWQLMFSSCSLWTPSIIIKRKISYRFDSSRRFCEDRMLFLQLALNGYKIARLELPLACIYKAPYGEGGLSSHLWEMEKGELDVFYHLRKMGFLSRGQEILLKSWSFLKYLRRLLIYRRLRRVV